MSTPRFAPPLRDVLARAHEEAARLAHEHVGTEHLLLALIADDGSDDGSGDGADDGARPGANDDADDGLYPALRALETLHVEREEVRRAVESTLRVGCTPAAEAAPSYTSSARQVLDYAIEEARVLGHASVGTSDLLVALVREERGVAAQVLRQLGVTVAKARKAASG